MTGHEELREKPWMTDKYFQINMFDNTSEGNIALGIHWHEHIEIIYILEGTATFNIGGENIEAGERDILFVNSGMLHSGFTRDINPMSFYAIVFDKKFLAGHAFDPSHIRYIAPYIEGRMLYPWGLKAGSEHHAEIEGILLNAIQEFKDKAHGYEVVVRSLLHYMTALLYRYFHKEEYSSRSSEIYDRNIENIKRLITHVREWYYEKMSIEEAAGFVNLSPYYFCKTFKRITGCTFIEYLNILRVNKAEELLLKSQMTVTEIAEAVGFCNINYFDRIFKRMKAFSPSSCRKSR